MKRKPASMLSIVTRSRTLFCGGFGTMKTSTAAAAMNTSATE